VIKRYVKGVIHTEALTPLSLFVTLRCTSPIRHVVVTRGKGTIMKWSTFYEQIWFHLNEEPPPDDGLFPLVCIASEVGGYDAFEVYFVTAALPHDEAGYNPDQYDVFEKQPHCAVRVTAVHASRGSLSITFSFTHDIPKGIVQDTQREWTIYVSQKALDNSATYSSELPPDMFIDEEVPKRYFRTPDAIWPGK
jgi:hypothetical protein